MALPWAFVAGVIAILTAAEYGDVLPGSGDPLVALAFVPALALPFVFAWLADRRIRLAIGRGRAPGPAATLLLHWLAPFSVPVVTWLLLVEGGYLDLCVRWSGTSQLLQVVLLFAPLWIAETGRVLAEVAPEAVYPVLAALRRDAGGPPWLPELRDCLLQVRLRLGWALLLCGPWLLLAAGADLLASQRDLLVFSTATSVGLVAAGVVFVCVLVVGLPFAFRCAFGLHRRLPEPVGSAVRETAAALGFPPRSVLMMPTGQRSLNAMLIGPLPWPRYLVLTDGLLDVLDLHALTGVVAHEVGHARAGHPLLLIGFASSLLLLVTGPFAEVDFGQLEPSWLGLGALGLVFVTWSLVRSIGFRFEHEADVCSVEAFGAAPCVRALQRVLRFASPPAAWSWRGITSLHPPEQRRIAVMLAFERDPDFRHRFRRAGRRLRLALLGIVAVCLGAASWSWSRSWPTELAHARFLVGDVAGARAQIERVGSDVSAVWWEQWARFQEEVACAAEIVGDGGRWNDIGSKLVEGSWRRGVQVLLADGPSAARPWFALALHAQDPSPLRRCVAAYCDAARNADPDTMERYKRHLQRLGVPAELAPVFAD